MDLQRSNWQNGQSYSSTQTTPLTLRPLQQPFFRALWMASIISNIGTWMHDAGAAWLMTTLTSSPILIALMQTASTLPVFILGLPAGALADLVDRRKLLLCTQVSMLLAAAALALLAFHKTIDPWILLALTFVLGAAAAVNSPAWQSAVTELVSPADLSAVVALTGMGLNMARALGPALGGALVAVGGAPLVFSLNAASFVGFIVVLYRWRRRADSQATPDQSVSSAMAAGIHRARNAPELRAVLVRTSLVVPCASVLWALLPVLARHEMARDAMGYGILFGCVGAGSVIGALILPHLRARYAINSLVARATVLLAAAIFALALVREFALLCLILSAAGVAWMVLMASFNLATQTAVPTSFRARALALYLLVVQGGMAGGSVIWGMIAQHGGIAAAFACAAAGLIGGLWAAKRYPLRLGKSSPKQPSSDGRDPLPAYSLEQVDGSFPSHRKPRSDRQNYLRSKSKPIISIPRQDSPRPFGRDKLI